MGKKVAVAFEVRVNALHVLWLRIGGDRAMAIALLRYVDATPPFPLGYQGTPPRSHAIFLLAMLDLAESCEVFDCPSPFMQRYAKYCA